MDMNEYLCRQLSLFGLSDKESRIYISSLELGAASVQQIAKVSEVNRATTYVAVESLIRRGLMSTTQSGKKRLFVAETPETIMSIIQKEKKVLEEKEGNIKSILGDLRLLSSGIRSRPKITFHEGLNGIERIRNHIKTSNSKYIEEFCCLDWAYKYFPPNEDDHRKYFRKTFSIRFIYTSSKGAILKSKDEGVVRKFVSHDKYPFDGDVAIFGDKAAIIYYSPQPLGVLVEHKGIANTLRQLFSLAWEGIKNET